MQVRLAGVLLLLAGCNADPEYERIAKEFLARGPKSACCSPPSGSVADCENDAEKKCAYARDATLTTKSIAERGNAARTVTIELSGPNGKGTCVVFVAESATGHGSRRAIKAESATCQPL